MTSSTRAIFVATKISTQSANVFQILKRRRPTLSLSLGLNSDVAIKQLFFSKEDLSGSSVDVLTQESKDLIPEIEVLFADPNFIVDVASHPNNRLKWAHSTFAGIDFVSQHRDKLKVQPDFVLTKTTGGFAEYMSEYVIGQIIARERKFFQMDQYQKKALWDGDPFNAYKAMDELSVGILGLGNIGSEVARVCKALKMTVWGAVRDDKVKTTRERCPDLDHVRGMSELSEMLGQCDYVVSVLPSTPETRGMLSGQVLQVCQERKTVFVNIGRGDIIDHDSLVNALKQGWLGGAILDVFNTEPLPQSSPLWSMEGVTITPHISGITSVSKCVNGFLDNYSRYKKGEPLKNVVNIDKGY